MQRWRRPRCPHHALQTHMGRCPQVSASGLAWRWPNCAYSDTLQARTCSTSNRQERAASPRSSRRQKRLLARTTQDVRNRRTRASWGGRDTFAKKRGALDGIGFDIPPSLSDQRMLASAVYDFHAEDTERGAKATMSTHCCQWKTSNAKNESGNREQINNFELQMSQTTSDANSPVGLDNGREYSVFGGWSDPS